MVLLDSLRFIANFGCNYYDFLYNKNQNIFLKMWKNSTSENDR